MRIEEITDNKIILMLPKKQRFFGLILLILGFLIPIFLYFWNSFQLIIINDSNAKFLILILGLTTFLIYLLVFQIPSLYYFHSIQNNSSLLGHLLLLVLNIVGYVAGHSSIFLFIPILITGIYLLLHFNSVRISRDSSVIVFHERVIALFVSDISIPFAEVDEIVLESKYKTIFFKKEPFHFSTRLYLFEKDPGFEDTPITDAEEADSSVFFRPQTLRRTLIQKPHLLLTCFLDFRGAQMKKIKNLLEKLVYLIEFSLVDDIKNDIGSLKKYKKK